MQEFSAIEYELYMYYKEDDVDFEEQQFKKLLEGTGVNEKEYKKLMNKISEIDCNYYKDK